MQRPTQFIRTKLRRYKKPLLVLFGVLITLAYPLKLVSQNISTSVALDETINVKQQLRVDYNYDLEVFNNIDQNSTKFSTIMNEYIENAEEEIYIAVYSFNIESIKSSLFRAAARGVDVHIIYNHERAVELDEFLGGMKQFFELTYVGVNKAEDDFYLMHHKFMIVDPGKENEVLFTGPWNWSYYQEDMDPNILLKIKDKEIIDSYLNEFLRLQKGEAGAGKFGNWDYAPWEKEITYPNGDVIEIWWSPGRNKNSLYNRIFDLLDEADTSIDIGVTILGSKPVARKLMEKASEGVDVQIIVDVGGMDTESSVIPWLKRKINEQNIENIKIIEGGKRFDDDQSIFAIFHYQNMIIDDEIVLTGTANWTAGGFFRNDENTLVIHSSNTAKMFSSIFDEYLMYLNEQKVDLSL